MCSAQYFLYFRTYCSNSDRTQYRNYSQLYEPKMKALNIHSLMFLKSDFMIYVVFRNGAQTQPPKLSGWLMQANYCTSLNATDTSHPSPCKHKSCSRRRYKMRLGKCLIIMSFHLTPPMMSTSNILRRVLKFMFIKFNFTTNSPPAAISGSIHRSGLELYGLVNYAL